jgi:hypothetical protein
MAGAGGAAGVIRGGFAAFRAESLRLSDPTPKRIEAKPHGGGAAGLFWSATGKPEAFRTDCGKAARLVAAPAPAACACSCHLRLPPAPALSLPSP